MDGFRELVETLPLSITQEPRLLVATGHVHGCRHFGWVAWRGAGHSVAQLKDLSKRAVTIESASLLEVQ